MGMPRIENDIPSYSIRQLDADVVILKHRPVLNGIPCAKLMFIVVLVDDNEPVENKKFPLAEVPSYKFIFKLFLTLHIAIPLINSHE
jgi:hypothetical protein